MRSSAVIALFVTSAVAQSPAAKTGFVAHIINPLGLQISTVTVLGSSSGTTTYVNSCSSTGIPASFLSRATAEASVRSGSSTGTSTPRIGAGTLELVPIVAPTAVSHLRRQDGTLLDGLCEPITIKQASETAQISMKDPTDGAWTAEMNCNWKGAMNSADLTCTATQSGFIPEQMSVDGTTTVTFKASEVAEAGIIPIVEVFSPTSNSANPTASGTQPGSASSTASGSGVPAATGAAASAPLPMGIMVFVGGAAGVFAAALAL